MQKHAHRLVVATAFEMAGALYEELAKDNKWYADWKACHKYLSKAALMDRFIKVTTPKLFTQARATLAKLLTTDIDEKLKEEIAEALLLDNSLIRGRHGRLN